jgi:hypothetical protein
MTPDTRRPTPNLRPRPVRRFAHQPPRCFNLQPVNGRADIALGAFRVGHLGVDASSVRGEGGSLSPALVIPASLNLDPREKTGTIAITELEADLVLPSGGEVGLGPVVGSPSRLSSLNIRGGLWVSLPTAPVEHRLEFRFSLAAEQVRLLENHAQRLGDEQVPIGLRLRIAAAWVRQSGNAPRPGPAGHPIPAATGLVSELWPAWEARIEPLEARLRREDWAAQVLPGLGADQVRLISVGLPSTSKALGAEAAAAIEAAYQRYDKGDYRGAVQACRDLRDSVRDRLDANETIAARVADLLALPADSAEIVLLDNLWKTLSDLSSAGHHKQGKQLGGAEARTCVVLAATAIEYLTSILDPDTLSR